MSMKLNTMVLFAQARRERQPGGNREEAGEWAYRLSVLCNMHNFTP